MEEKQLALVATIFGLTQKVEFIDLRAQPDTLSPPKVLERILH